jgi:tRNA(Ile)-lysidine synthase
MGDFTVKAAHPLVAEVGKLLSQLRAKTRPMVVAVSGGPDSVALLRALVALQTRTSPPLVLAHLNHQLRGQESDADESFVRTLHGNLLGEGAWSLELRCERLDVAARARAEGANLEASARQARYDWLTAIARETHAAWVATGHTADDQAETVLHHLLRGTGLNGLRGIALQRGLVPGIDVIRPLLRVTRAQVLDFLSATGQRYCKDQSNSNCEYTRNRLRHELLPHLAEHYNPAVRTILTRLAEQTEEVYAELEERARTLLKAAERPRAGALVVLDRATLEQAPGHLVREGLRLIWDREGWPRTNMGYAHWSRLLALITGKARALELPGGVCAQRRERVLQLGRPETSGELHARRQQAHRS